MPITTFPSLITDLRQFTHQVASSSPDQIRSQFEPETGKISYGLHCLKNDGTILHEKECADLKVALCNKLGTAWTRFKGDIEDSSVDQTQIQSDLFEFASALEEVYDKYAHILDRIYRPYAQGVKFIANNDSKSPLDYLQIVSKINGTLQLAQQHIDNNQLIDALNLVTSLPNGYEERAELLLALGCKFLAQENLPSALNCLRLLEASKSDGAPLCKLELLNVLQNAVVVHSEMRDQALEYIKAGLFPNEMGLFLKMSDTFLSEGKLKEAYQVLCFRFDVSLGAKDKLDKKTQRDLLAWMVTVNRPMEDIFFRFLKRGQLNEAIEMTVYLRKFGIDCTLSLPTWLRGNPSNTLFSNQSSEREVLEFFNKRVEKCASQQNPFTAWLKEEDSDSSDEESNIRLTHKNAEEDLGVDFATLSMNKKHKS